MKTYPLAEPVDGKYSWQDGKRYAWLLGLVVPILPFLAIGLHQLTGLSAVLWLGPVVVLVIVPAIDLVAGKDPTNPPDEIMAELEEDRYYRWVTYAYLPVQYAGLITGIWYIATAGAPTIGNIGLAITLGTVSGVAINTAHELGHKREDVERWAAKIALAPCFYGHFYVEHNRGHHVRVSTPEDPASARMGESFYRFWPRTVFGSLASAWRLERKRYARRDRHPFRIGNDVLNSWLMSLVLWGALIALFGWGVLPYLLIQAVFGLTLLELVNYMEHYGMLRQKVGPADRRRFERVTPAHSWNSNNIATNVLLYHLQRHSDHHANPTRRFQTLRDFPEAPVLPTGYTGMMLAAIVPPVFRRVMDPLVLAHYDGDLRLANVHPAKREKLLAAYPPPADEVPQEETDQARQKQVDGVTAARCPGCGYTYEVAAGNEAEGFPAGTAWSEIPDDWTCPDCGVRDKVDFVALDREGV
ncbi:MULTISPECIES: fatty acid desaturase [Pseudonocardia]|uniref:Alkane 1-monooxygenase n=2 Tax=Pseudonocardia TaxID=1847 RepID=A0A1Y2MTK6_PSEAH|nr:MULTISPECIES: fatty acid desaturase [Pseudonocardia]OSY38534.1 Alkane 1-monooxygenase [Pseudonocardia autotrophica]TDN77023.1 alkane 1-monooxygenase [Pseudonocardia autotrophica]BBG01029.1 alkane 1-monooxygenase [Pseudonocardia autotrophica]GEC26657.1 alkane 1-monooxygenase [Pseudonocardia saturnea]